jgi:bifunctional DNase/RNase
VDTFKIDLKEIVINNLVDGIFYAILVFVQGGKEVEVDSRTSDALALAVRYGCPIYSYEFILDQAGIILEEDTEREVQKAKTRRQQQTKEKEIEDYSTEDLEVMLEKVLEEEDYERAARIRDELNRRKEEGEKN